jgi:hypothetical protein
MSVKKRASKAKVKAEFGSHVTVCVQACLDALGVARGTYRVACTPSDILRLAGRVGYSLRRHPRWSGKSVGKLSAAVRSGRESGGWLVFVDGHVLIVTSNGKVDTSPRQRDRRRIVLAWRITRK